ncbi:MAG TPA: MFS transporter [Casimicrobiaceae bacterium]|nr:MFS transporter [Casimicrobiaceae bacterium]
MADPIPSTVATPARTGSALEPLRHSTFRMLWIVWLIANMCMWMNDVGAAWLMTSLTSSPVMVALVQSAATLPVFLLGLPSGALADIIDRRRFLIFTQVWTAVVALLICAAMLTETLNAPLLLCFTLANGIGLAMRWPVFAALIPELVPRAELTQALALNAIGMNLSRVVGPAAAGALIASFGPEYVFVLNAVLSTLTAITLLGWKREQKGSRLPNERMLGAMRVGVQHVRQSPHLQAVLVRAGAFFLNSSALIALLPLIAKRLEGGGAGAFTALLASLGIGAIITALWLPRLRGRMTRDGLVRYGTIAQAVAMLAMAFVPNLWLAIPATLVAGAAWIAVINSLTVGAQMLLPDWVRARGMSIYQMALMGGTAIGSALWGQVASWRDVRTSLVLASIAAIAGLWVMRNLRVGGRADEDLTPARLWTAPELAIPVEPDQGPVLVTVEYRIDPARKEEFVELMRESRRVWMSNGILAWELFDDVSDPGGFIEHLVDESWAAYVRRNERVSSSYTLLRERKLAFHLGDEPPKVRRFVAEPMRR